VAVVLTLVKKEHNRNNTKSTLQIIQNTVNTSTYITKTPKHTRAHPCIRTPTHTNTNTLQDPSWKLKGTSKKLSENSLLNYVSSSAINSPYTALPEIYLRRNIFVKNGTGLTSTVQSYVYNNLMDYYWTQRKKRIWKLTA